MKTEIKPLLNFISLARIRDNSENLRKPEKAKTNIIKLSRCKRSFRSALSINCLRCSASRASFRYLKADRTFFNCYHCRMRSGRTDASKIMQPLKSVERIVDSRNGLGLIEQILKKQSTMDGFNRKHGNDTQDFCGKRPPSVKNPRVI